MIDQATIGRFKGLTTPFYYYDTTVLKEACERVKEASERYSYKVHYAVKANANHRILKIIASFGFGADCVSWNEIERALSCGFPASEIVFAGVGKTDSEIEKALRADIFCFNCESLMELEIINSCASQLGKTATLALRINPYVEAFTHKYITTGIEESKFGISTCELDEVLHSLSGFKNIDLKGIHLHIGSQITRMSVFKSLCSRINELMEYFASHDINLRMINVGGGLGIDYKHPDNQAGFQEYFSVINKFVRRYPDQVVHIEPGRSIVGQCGTLISRVLYIKKGSKTTFAVIDAGMNDLIRPALYQACHRIENLTSLGQPRKYDVVGPVCESSDTFAKFAELPETRRGDIIAIRSAGAYGESMASRYNLRDLPGAVFSDEL